MSNLVLHASQEMRRVGLYDVDADYGGMIPDAVMALITTFADQGHSGASASIVTQLFTELAQFKPLGPLTNDPDEWMKVDPGIDEGTWQNRRQPEAFSEDGGKTYYLLGNQRKWVRRLLPWQLYRRLPSHLRYQMKTSEEA